MHRILLLCALIVITGNAWSKCPEFLNHDFRKLHSKESIQLCDLATNNVLLLVNTASHCGFTPQFKDLEAIHQRYRDKGLVVIGFPSNDFDQAASSEEKAHQICHVNYGVSFTMVAPSSVRGNHANPVFAELARQSHAPSWNFSKYLVDRDGRVVKMFGSNISPQDDILTTALEHLLDTDE